MPVGGHPAWIRFICRKMRRLALRGSSRSRFSNVSGVKKLGGYVPNPALRPERPPDLGFASCPETSSARLLRPAVCEFLVSEVRHQSQRHRQVFPLL